jgi:hypothetical protein
MMILGHLIPEGPVEYIRGSRLYVAAFSLVLTCRKLSAETHSVWYHSKCRPLAIRVCRYNVVAGETGYGSTNRLFGDDHIIHLPQETFGFFRHLRMVVVHEIESRDGDGDLYPCDRDV